MKYIYHSVIVILALCSFLLCVPGVSAEQMTIQIKEAQLRSQPSFLGKIEVTLSYGDRVIVLEERTDWVLVGVPNSSLQGWVHASALSTKKLKLQAGPSSTGASSDELVLAGKGFNAEVEARYKQENQELDYARIDRMEREFPVAPQAIRQFLTAGGLVPAGGAL